ncbi:MAG: Tn3 family transposase, partial [Streptosporangiaceae bacterium]
ETYRRDIKGIRNLQEGRHALARKICHGKKGELYHRYERGLENQLGVLGLVLNCVVLWTTVYLDAAVRQLKAQGYPVREEDMTRLSPFVSRHLGVHGAYSFLLPDLAPGAIRELRDPDGYRQRQHISWIGLPLRAPPLPENFKRVYRQLGYGTVHGHSLPHRISKIESGAGT